MWTILLTWVQSCSLSLTFFPNKVCSFYYFSSDLFELLLKMYIHFISNHLLLFSYYFCYFIVGNHLKETVCEWCKLVLMGSRTFKNIQSTLGKERCTISCTNLSMHLKSILGALLPHTLKIRIVYLFTYLGKYIF